MRRKIAEPDPWPLMRHAPQRVVPLQRHVELLLHVGLERGVVAGLGQVHADDGRVQREVLVLDPPRLADQCVLLRALPEHGELLEDLATEQVDDLVPVGHAVEEDSASMTMRLLGRSMLSHMVSTGPTRRLRSAGMAAPVSGVLFVSILSAHAPWQGRMARLTSREVVQCVAAHGRSSTRRAASRPGTGRTRSPGSSSRARPTRAWSSRARCRSRPAA